MLVIHKKVVQNKNYLLVLFFKQSKILVMEFVNAKIKRLINAEFYQFLFLLLDIIGKLGVAKLKVTNKSAELSSIVSRLLVALSREKDTTQTSEMNVSDKERVSAFIGLSQFVKGIAKSPEANTRAQAIVIKNYLKTLGTGLTRKNKQEKSALLSKLVNDFIKLPSLVSANAAVKTQVFITEIDIKNKAYIAKYESRNATESSNESTLESFVSIRPEAEKVFEEMLKLMIGRYETNIEDKVDNTDIITAIEQINQLIDKYNQLVKSSVPKKPKKATTPIVPNVNL